jgi:hypothetical protein
LVIMRSGEKFYCFHIIGQFSLKLQVKTGRISV